MMGDDHFYFRDHRHHHLEDDDEEQDAAEEALSLSDFPLHDHLHPNSDEPLPLNDISDHPRRSSSQPQDFFEFFHVDDLSSDHIMCSADDIIICGKLVPFKEPYCSPNPAGSNPFVDDYQEKAEEEAEETKLQINKAALGLRSRSESSSNLHSGKTKLTWNSRSLDYRKLQRHSSPILNSPEMVNKNASTKGSGKSTDVSAKRATRPRWSVFMFGMAKFPAEMELEDIKTRQLRRNPTTLFVPAEQAATAGGNLPQSRYKGSWKILKALSCKDHTSVAVTTSFACLSESESFA